METTTVQIYVPQEVVVNNCPFCQGVNIKVTAISVVCNTCLASGPTSATQSIAVELWNKALQNNQIKVSNLEQTIRELVSKLTPVTSTDELASIQV